MRRRAYGQYQHQRRIGYTGFAGALVVSCLFMNSVLVPIARAEPATSLPVSAPVPTEEEPVALPTGPLTVNSTVDHYTIAGTIDDPKAMFTIHAGDTEVTSAELQPVVAPEPTEAGVYTWQFTMPSTVAAGEQQIRVAAKTYNDAGEVLRELPEVLTTLVLVVAPPPTPNPPVLPVDPPKKDDTVLPVVTEPLPLTPQIGQFVAPEVGEATPGTPTITGTKLYGVPVGDLVQSTAAASGRAGDSASNTDGGVLGMKTTAPLVDHASSSTALAPSSQGWQFFGVAWYWLALVAVLFVIGSVLVVRAALRPLRAVLPQRSLASS